jgi:hypothetical protein
MIPARIRSGGRLNENQYSGGDKQERSIALVTVCGEAVMKKAQQIAIAVLGLAATKGGIIRSGESVYCFLCSTGGTAINIVPPDDEEASLRRGTGLAGGEQR